MTNRSYFQFDTRSRLRRFFASSEGWSPLNKKVETARDAGCDAEHCTQVESWEHTENRGTGQKQWQKLDTGSNGAR